MPRNTHSDDQRTPPLTEAPLSGEPEVSAWPIANLAAAWLNMSMQMWAAWFELWGVKPALPTAGRRDENERRNRGFPWLPQIETTIVPFRRRDDEAGAEAAKLSMRVQMPGPQWAGEGRSTIAVETLMPRPSGRPGAPH